MGLVETKEFQERSARLFTEDQRDALLIHLAQHPEAGDVIPETHGVRKLRWSALGRGKRGGARVIYYFHGSDMPLVLITAYAKNRKSDLTGEEKKELRNLVPELVRQLRGRK
jgi:mRNA-degrading endonuclease RelE of RelBE toxin-antitoxin system